jgi:hypothetical protein
MSSAVIYRVLDIRQVAKLLSESPRPHANPMKEVPWQSSSPIGAGTSVTMLGIKIIRSVKLNCVIINATTLKKRRKKTEDTKQINNHQNQAIQASVELQRRRTRTGEKAKETATLQASFQPVTSLQKTLSFSIQRHQTF